MDMQPPSVIRDLPTTTIHYLSANLIQYPSLPITTCVLHHFSREKLLRSIRKRLQNSDSSVLTAGRIRPRPPEGGHSQEYPQFA